MNRTEASGFVCFVMVEKAVKKEWMQGRMEGVGCQCVAALVEYARVCAVGLGCSRPLVKLLCAPYS